MSGTAIVVGAGIGGLTAALALRRKGWQVDIHEQAPAIGPVGAGVGIAPNAVKALRHLGLGEDLRDRGRRQEAMEIRVQSGRRLARIPASSIERRYGAPFYALHRAELHRLLMRHLGTAMVHTNHHAIRLTPDTVTFRTPEGSKSATADLVVVADGVNSHLRSALFPSYPGPDYAGYTVWRGIVPATSAASLDVPAVLSETWGRGARFGVAVLNDGQIYWFACENMTEADQPEHNLGLLAERFQSWHDPIPRLLAATPEDSLLRHDVYYLRASLPGFVRGRVALLGDAAHAVTPDIGQGACLAIEDAVVLASAIDEHGIDHGLRAYDAVRRPRTETMARSSGKLAGILQSSSRAVVGLRDAVTLATPTPLFMRAAGTAFAWTPPRDRTTHP